MKKEFKEIEIIVYNVKINLELHPSVQSFFDDEKDYFQMYI